MVKELLQRLRLIGFLLIIPFSISFATPPNNFDSAKKMAADLFSNHRVTLYCGCSYSVENKVDLKSCGMDTAAPIARANRIEWEHMMPAEHFGRYHKCWTEQLCVNDSNGKAYKGRKCCEKIDADFRRKEAELYNLWPAVGAVNQERSNYTFTVIPNKRGFYGCEFDADKDKKLAEPPDRAKGIVARANLFMADKYKIEFSKEQRDLFNTWNKKFPPDAWELKWAEKVASTVGYKNPYITTKSKDSSADS